MNLTLGQVVSYLYASLFGEPPATLSKTKIPASQSLYDFTAKFSRIANIAYCINAPVTPLRTDFSCGESCRYFPNLTLDSVFGGDFYSTSITGYIAYDHVNKEKYVAIRGTFSIPDAVTDIQFQQSPWLVALPKHLIPTEEDMNQSGVEERGLQSRGLDYRLQNRGLDNLNYLDKRVIEDPRLIPLKTNNCSGCMIHDGFAKAFNETMVNAGQQFEHFLANHTDYKMYITGHSLGAAQALLLATHFKLLGHDPTMINFGQPRVGNSEFANYINQLWFNDTGLQTDENRRNYRITHWNDIVTRCPCVKEEKTKPAIEALSTSGQESTCSKTT
ncbi:putative lipase [Yarrowia sp. C11]|nr:putative lipase [Yarrowia sp. E02]KAG5371788.1 putative lipase [Yarrowia sp. C11]